ncbi:MAG: hypothetical protein FJX53_10860, partial [Alphaproteobacteria bacterium]|nr:hypothetical protein [Alphaproteobacteria bacterium]
MSRAVDTPAPDCDSLAWSAASRAAWQAAWNAAPAGHPLADPRWFEVIGRVWGVDRHVLALRGGAGGVLPVYAVRSVSGGRHLFSPKHALLAGSDDDAEILLGGLAALARRQRARSAAVTSGDAAHVVTAAQWTRTGQELALPGDADAFWRGLRDKVRNTVRKAERAEIAVARDAGHVDAFWRLQAAAMTARCLPVKPRRFFREMAAAFADRMTLYTALAAGRPAGGMLVLR